MYTYSKLKVKLMKTPTNFIMHPTPILYIGADSVLRMGEILNGYGAKKVLVVTDKALMGLGLLKPVLEQLDNNRIKYVIYDDVTPDPTYEVVHGGIKICNVEKCDAIVAFGGGSVLDATKIISASYCNQIRPEKLEGLLKVKQIGLPFIAVPTTAGTGSETTIAAVISDTKTHRKTVVIDPKIVPQVAILDSKLTVGLPPHITAATAIDALTHAVEAYVSRYATKESRKKSEISIRLIYENLERVYRTPDDLAGREALLLASFYGGMAFTRTYVGYVHAFAHNIGGRFGVPHGLANAVLLAPIMEHYMDTCEKEFAELACLVGIADDFSTQEEKAKVFIDSLKRLIEAVGIPKTLDKFPKTSVSEVRRAGFKECHGTYPVPKYLTAMQADAILNTIAVS